MKPLFLLVFLSAMLTLSGCATSRTDIKLSGTTNSTFFGYYISPGGTNTISGNIPMVIELSGVTLKSCEFKKASTNDTLILEIYHGGQQSLRAPASPGTTGIRAAGHGPKDWHFEVLRD